MLAVEDLAEAPDGLGHRHVLAAAAGELFGDEERLREEALDLAGAGDRLPILVGELVDAEDGDDVLQLLVALQNLLDVGRGAVVVLADDVGLEDRRGRVERVDGRVDPFSEIARESVVVALRWANTDAGAGSVRSSAGT
ncbi:MAG: hypothetical protein U0R26_03825 [Solirubrobacterales bacterium]